jgi:DNA polymerase III delta prime subunit
MVCEGFFESTIRERIAGKPDLFSAFGKYQTQGRILQPRLDSKNDIRGIISEFQTVYPEPTLLFLGSLDSYSTALQEGLLKLLEEPPHNLNIVMFARAASTLLPTIQSRSRLLFLKSDVIMHLLDATKSEKVAKKLPKAGEFTKELLTNSIDQSYFQSTDIAKLEREEIDLWLWQVAINLNHVYQKSSKKSVAMRIESVLKAQNLNQNNVQKKFVLFSLFSS